MATRLYGVANDVPGISPAFSVSFSGTGQAVRRFMTTSKLTTTEQKAGTLSGAAGNNAAIAQWISAPLVAQTISGTVNINMRGLETSAASNIDQFPYRLFVVSNDGTVVRGVLVFFVLAGGFGEIGTVFGTINAANGTALTNVNALAGDRIVLEWGLGESGIGTTPGWQVTWGGTGTDMVAVPNDTTGSVPWMEFSGNIAFQNAVATVDANLSQANISGEVPGADFVALFRVAPGETVTQYVNEWRLANTGAYPRNLVRPLVDTDPTTGWGEITSNGWGYWVDTEAPLDTPWLYTLYDTVTGATYPAPAPTTVVSNSVYHFRDPLNPHNDLILHNTTPTVADCVPQNGLYFATIGDESYANQSNYAQVDGSPFMVNQARVRSAAAAQINIVSRSFDSRDDLILLLALGTTLLFTAPPQYGVKDTYMDCGDLGVGRPLSDMRRQWRLDSVPYNSNIRPVGIAQGAIKQAWIDTALPTFPYETWTQVGAANINTFQLVTLAF